MSPPTVRALAGTALLAVVATGCATDREPQPAPPSAAAPDDQPGPGTEQPTSPSPEPTATGSATQDTSEDTAEETAEETSEDTAEETSEERPTGPTGALVPDGEGSDVVTGLQAPWDVAIIDAAVLVTERDSGRILQVTDGGGTREVGLVDGVAHGGEGGLLGLAWHEGDLLVYFTAEDGNRVVRYALEGSVDRPTLGERQDVLTGIPSGRTHNGGRIAIGPDGMLYVTAGDAGDPDRAQDPDSLGGKILRLTPTGEVPGDNPVTGNPMWSMGHRNPQGLGWHADGTLVAAEFGQDTWDELNVIEPGANYGWPVVEGEGGREEFVDPLLQWPTSEASPSGLAVVGDTVFVANLRGQRLRAVPLEDPQAATEHLTDLGRLRHALLGPDGSLWVVTNNTDGRGEPRDGDDRILSVPLAPG